MLVLPANNSKNSQGGVKIVEECAAQKKMVDSLFILGAGDLAQNAIKWIVHIRAFDDEAACEKGPNTKQIHVHTSTIPFLRTLNY